MSRPEGPIRVAALSEPEARVIAQWRYQHPYDFYDGDEREIEVMLDPAHHYYAVHAVDELVGYICVGPDARVAGQEPINDIDDLGWGFRPHLVGRGIASRWLPSALELIRDELTKPRHRVIVINWNGRSQTVARRMGFEASGTHRNAHGDWVLMCRPRPSGLSH